MRGWKGRVGSGAQMPGRNRLCLELGEGVRDEEQGEGEGKGERRVWG